MLVLILAMSVAVAPLDARHATLRSLIVTAGDGAGCTGAQLTSAVAGATFQRLGSIGGDEVALASVDDSCICGAQNCPYYVVRFGRPAKLLYATFGISAGTKPGSPLPALVFTAHDSALVVDVTTAVWRNGAYRDARTERVRGDTGAEKPDGVPIRFAAGASSTVLRGSASSGWYDSYAFSGAKGQRLTLSVVQAGAPVHVLVYPADDAGAVAEVTPGRPYALPKTGSYRLQIELDTDADKAYAVRFAIR